MLRARSVLVTLILAVMTVWFLAVGLATPASADDVLESFQGTYSVQTDGSVAVSETLVWRFGVDSGRHGIERVLVSREPYDDTSDMLFGISNIDVSSPDSVSTDWSTSTESTSARDSSVVIRIGDPQTRIDADTVTYVITYDLTGALRTFDGYSEFYWDVLGSGNPPVTNASAIVTTPGGASEVQCAVGAAGATRACTSAMVDDAGDAHFLQDGRLGAGDLFTVDVRIPPGEVSNATPNLVARGDSAERTSTRILQGLGLASMVLIPLAGALYVRRRGRDHRYAGLPPGTFPAMGAPAAVEIDDPRTQIPVSFTPPDLPLSHAGFLLDGRTTDAHLTASLVELATVGALQLSNAQGPTAVARDPRRVPNPQDEEIYDALFGDGEEAVDIATATQLADAARWLAQDARGAASRWFIRMPGARRRLSLPVTVFITLVLVLMFGGFSFAWFLLPAWIAWVVTSAVVRTRVAKGQRSALGRALTDQVEGFRTYVATAEADQLRFEEGVDVFSRYLPWAVLFGLTDRWVTVCRKAIELGRLKPPDTSWYGGTFWDGPMVLRNLTQLSQSVAPAVTPTTRTFRSTRGTGFGGGSGFSRGGLRAGGGGGGGGSRSW